MSGGDEYLYVLRGVRPGMVDEGPTADELAVLEAHGRYLRKLARRGVVLHAGRTQEDGARSMGLVAFRARSPEEARALMNADPAVAQGVLKAELHSYRSAVHGAYGVRAT